MRNYSDPSNNFNPEVDRKIGLLIRLLTLALDKAAQEAEARSALDKAMTHARANGIDFYAVASHVTKSIGNGHTQFKTPTREIRLTFGRHKGRTIAEIYALDPDYLLWITTTLRDRNPFLRQRVQEFLLRASQP
jgi:hypothetical protein